MSVLAKCLRLTTSSPTQKNNTKMQSVIAVLLFAAAASAAVVPYNTAVVRSDRVGNSFAYSIHEAAVPNTGAQAGVKSAESAPIQKYQSFVQLGGSPVGSPVGYAGVVPVGHPGVQLASPVAYSGYSGGFPVGYGGAPYGHGVNYVQGGNVPVAVQQVAAFDQIAYHG